MCETTYNRLGGSVLEDPQIHYFGVIRQYQYNNKAFL